MVSGAGPSLSSKGVILGTAGHIDHGKSSLVKALTGIDPDRLKEEKERGITIELGFANLSYPEDNLTVGIVDVPGHERLIKNMLAGAGGIDIVLLVIAADEGVMPQSREHLAICELLKTKSGMVVITKSDLVDKEWMQTVVSDVRNFVKGTFLGAAEIIGVSVKTGENLGLLKQKIRDLAKNVKPKLVNGIFRLPVDRVFTLKGFGTVVTGTALSGTIGIDEPVEILPSAIRSRVRGLQTHGSSVEKALAGQRTGLNLQGVEKELLRRGDVIVLPDRLTPTVAIDARLNMLGDAPTLKSRSRVHFYTGTSETIARLILYGVDEIKAGGSCFCQFRLEAPVVALSGDRYIVRRFSPLETIGGGEILDPHPIKRRKKMGTEDLELLEKGSLPDKIATLVKRSHFQGSSVLQVEGWFNADLPEITSGIDKLAAKGVLIKSKGRLFHKESFDAFQGELKTELQRYHAENPLKAGMPKEGLKARMTPRGRTDEIFELVAGMAGIVIEKEIVRLSDFRAASSSSSGGGIRDRIVSTLSKEGFQPSLKPELAQALGISEKETADLLKLLAQEGVLVRINDALFITKENYDKMISLLRDFYSRKKEMGVAEFRDLLGTSRKFSIPFLEYLDSNRITIRVGDVRKFMLK
jgi:selenocysteine-specific elongation factor